MILTGSLIADEVRQGHITIDPFDPAAVNPNSCNYRLGPRVKRYDDALASFVSAEIPADGVELVPHQTYLGHTLEIIGSSTYAMSLIGRSSMGRLGLFLQVSANLGHTTSCHRWTLEIVATRPIRICAGMVIGQVSFWCNWGAVVPTRPYYSRFSDPEESALIRSTRE
jgi:dCTP deaminase